MKQNKHIPFPRGISEIVKKVKLALFISSLHSLFHRSPFLSHIYFEPRYITRQCGITPQSSNQIVKDENKGVKEANKQGINPLLGPKLGLDIKVLHLCESCLNRLVDQGKILDAVKKWVMLCESCKETELCYEVKLRI